MKSASNSGVENTCDRFPPRSSTTTKVLLSRVARISAYDSVVQEDCGVPNGTVHWPDRLGRSHDARQLPQAQQTERVVDISVVPLGYARQLCRDSKYQVSTDQRVETGDVPMAREVASVKPPSHRSEFE